MTDPFYTTLSEVEKDYWHKLMALFQLVTPQKPEKGAKTIILRARKSSQETGVEIQEALETLLLEATERTHRRIALLDQCNLPNKNNDPS